MSLPPGFDYTPEWLQEPHADRLLEALQHEIPWRQQAITLFGREVMQPRLTAWCADPGVSYQYSGLRLQAQRWHPALDLLRQQLAREHGAAFNSVLLNCYRNGRDSMGWHADDEPELGPQPVIASVSLGAVRRMLIRRAGGGSSVGLDLGHGSLLMMQGDSQSDWRHSIPKVAREAGPRINLTFRVVLTA